MARILFCLLLLPAVCFADEDVTDSRVIPLGEIWAYQMPGTTDVRKLDAARREEVKSREDALNSSQWLRILVLLGERLPDGEVANRGFLVEGTGKEALTNALRVFQSRKESDLSEVESEEAISADTEMSVIFFTHYSGRYVHIESVERAGNKITVKYRFVSHLSADVTTHFAIIPVGKFTGGTGRVEIERLSPVHGDDPEQPVKPVPKPKQIVCTSFSFKVEEQ